MIDNPDYNPLEPEVNPDTEEVDNPKKIENPETSHNIKIFGFQTCLKDKPQVRRPLLNLNYRYSLLVSPFKLLCILS